MIDESEQTKSRFRVLHLEDDPLDVELIKIELQKRHILCSVIRIWTQKHFEAELQKGGIDLILSDSQLPNFDTLSALMLARQRHPDVPFIFVSGTISPNIKEVAFRRGATDFVGKDDLPRLTQVVNWLFSTNKRKHKIPPLPEIGMPVIVQCKEFRCLGYLDRNGIWRDFEKSSELSDVIDWFDL